jgi:Mg2+/Co2+ transporter CorC
MLLSVPYLIIDGLLWLAVYLLGAIVFQRSTLSSFELRRRTESGDAKASEQTRREMLLPRLETLRRILLAIFLVLAISISVVTFGWIVGTLLSAILYILSGTVTRYRVVTRAAQSLYGPHEKRMFTLAEGWQWLDVLQSTIQSETDSVAASKAELRHIIARSSSVLSRDELSRLQASMSFDEHVVEDIMTPVSVVETADVADSLGPLVLDGLHKTGHSRFPVIDGDIHHVVGILYLHDIINLKSAKQSVREAMDPRVHYIHEQQSLEHALHGFLRTHHHLFVVVNDYRETVGVLSLEDVLETLLGKKIVDEFDRHEDLRAVAESNPRRNNVPKGKTDI